jgi:hypothetical protein
MGVALPAGSGPQGRPRHQAQSPPSDKVMPPPPPAPSSPESARSAPHHHHDTPPRNGAPAVPQERGGREAPAGGRGGGAAGRFRGDAAAGGGGGGRGVVHLAQHPRGLLPVRLPTPTLSPAPGATAPLHRAFTASSGSRSAPHAWSACRGAHAGGKGGGGVCFFVPTAWGNGGRLVLLAAKRAPAKRGTACACDGEEATTPSPSVAWRQVPGRGHGTSRHGAVRGGARRGRGGGAWFGGGGSTRQRHHCTLTARGACALRAGRRPAWCGGAGGREGGMYEQESGVDGEWKGQVVLAPSRAFPSPFFMIGRCSLIHLDWF